MKRANGSLGSTAAVRERPGKRRLLARQRRDSGRHPSGSHQGWSGHTSAQPVNASVDAGPCLRYNDHIIGQGPAFYEKACALPIEGIVSKRIDAPYTPGNRGLWRKVKCLNRAEFVVVGWTEPEGRRPYLGACCSPITIRTEG